MVTPFCDLMEMYLLKALSNQWCIEGEEIG